MRVTTTKRLMKEAVVELLKEGDASLINVRTICERAGINRTTFYNHYQDKEALLKDMALDTVDASCIFLKAFLEKKNPSLALTQMLLYYRNNASFFLTLMKTDYSASFTKLMIKTIWEQYSQWAKGKNLILGDFERYRVTFNVSGIIYLIAQWLEEKESKNPPTIASYIMNNLSGQGDKPIRKC